MEHVRTRRYVEKLREADLSIRWHHMLGRLLVSPKPSRSRSSQNHAPKGASAATETKEISK